VATERRTLSTRELNRALLARQMLLERSALSIPRALDRMGGLQAQYAPSMYVGLWSRLRDFDRTQLDRALERRSVVQGTLMRSTIHLVSASDYWPMAVGVRRGRREHWLKTGRRDVSAAQIGAAARKLRSRISGTEMRRREIDELLVGGSVVTNGVNLWLDLLRIPPSGTWEHRRADLYALAEDWIGPPTRISEDEAIELLVRRYLGGFGPAPLRDIAGWAGVPPKRIAAVAEGMRLRRFSDEDGEELVDLPRSPIPDADAPAPARFIPTWDATLLVHARRTGILPEEHRPKVFNTRTPQSVSTFLVDGRVAGTWTFEKGKVKLSPFGRLDASAGRELREEGERLAELHA
jgi:hypothetical protein